MTFCTDLEKASTVKLRSVSTLRLVNTILMVSAAIAAPFTFGLSLIAGLLTLPALEALADIAIATERQKQMQELHMRFLAYKHDLA